MKSTIKPKPTAKKARTTRSIYDEYFEYDDTYKAKYGGKTCVLLEVGSFFEIYTYKTLSTNTVQHPHTTEISRICNLSLVEKKASYKTDDQQIMMMGFRNYMLDKYLQKLVDVDYTVAVFTQKKDGKDVTRSLDAVYSHGTFIRYDENEEEPDGGCVGSNYMVCIWMETYTAHSAIRAKTSKQSVAPSALLNQKIIYGISAVNIFTGHSSIFEHDTPYIMNPTTFDEMERFLSTFAPGEVVVISNTIDEKNAQTILRFAGVQCNTVHIITTTGTGTATPAPGTVEKVRNCEKQTYIQSILATYYDNPTIYQEEFHQYPIATQSFCFLLDFIKEHNYNLIRKIAVPTFTNTSNRMILANHTLRQLNIINDQTTDGGRSGVLSSVLAFTNRCKTSIGRRLFQRKLLSPTFDEERLEREYGKIGDILKIVEDIPMDEIRTQLSQIRDIEKIYRQIISKKIYPSSIWQLYNSVIVLKSLQERFTEMWGGGGTSTPFDIEPDTPDKAREFADFLASHFHLDICQTTTTVQSFEHNIIQSGVNKSLDKMLIKRDIHAQQLSAIHEYFNELIRNSPLFKEKTNDTTPPTEYVKLHETDKSGFSFQITKKRGTILKKILATTMATEQPQPPELSIPVGGEAPTIHIPIQDIRIIGSTTSNDEIEIPFLSKLSRDILKTQEELNATISAEYFAIIETVEKEWTAHLSYFIEYIGNMDVLISKAFLARKYNYCRPAIDSASAKSYVKATKMRHCLIEHLQTNEIYVPNDLTLGTEEMDGILLFGTNAIGKTSLIRSIGVCVVLAQAGLYVPCESFIYKPYTALFSRIIGNDNLFKNLSTFQVEISELAVILKQADGNSLILGDEICSSTELESGLSIIMSALMEFHAREASFIFATHFHEIVKWKEMEQLPRIHIKHLAVSFDPSTGKLIYDRKLKDGEGITSYGLTVCKSMNLPMEFMERAFEIRNRHYPENVGILSFQPSKYNAKKLVGLCEICKKEFSTEIHHKEPQKNADGRGFIRTADGKLFHKNHPANLMSLCELCHKKAHLLS
jgi:DNA mismatch repair protein MutS